MKKWVYILIISIVAILVAGYVIVTDHLARVNPTPQIENKQAAPENRTLIKGGGACVKEDLTIDPATITCVFITKDKCDGNFNQGILCSAEELKTLCGPTKVNIYADNELYFVDSCGNQANPSDISQYNNKSYWTYSLK